MYDAMSDAKSDAMSNAAVMSDVMFVAVLDRLDDIIHDYIE